jgi:DNA polymerase-3 subunit delta
MSVHLVKGSDPILRDEALDGVVRELLGGEERMLALEEFTIPGKQASEGEAGGSEAREAAVRAALNAARTLPFMTAVRVVVVREVGHLTKEEAAPLVEYLADPSPSTELVFVAGGGTTPKSLEDAVKKSGIVLGPEAEKPSDVLARQVAATGVRVQSDAAKRILDHVGADAGLLPGLVETLAAVYGEGAELGVDEVVPYLGDVGRVPTWDLTNAIEHGDVAEALAVLRRLLRVTSPTQPKAMHPLQVMAVLHNHFRRLARLDDPRIVTNEDAAAALGGRTSPGAASHRLRQARTLGTEGLRRAFDHLASADLDLKGARAIPPEVVMEVLVARLAALGSPGGRRPSRRGRSA